MSGKTGPVATVTDPVRGTTVKIYKTGGAFTLAYYVGRERKREKRATLPDARTRAKELLDDHRGGTQHVRQLSAREVAVVDAAIESLRTIRVPMSQACSEYAEAWKILDGTGSVVEAAREFMKTANAARLQPTKFSVVSQEFQARNVKLGRSSRYQEDCRKHLTAVGRTLDNALIASITNADIAAAIARATKGGPRAYNNIRGTVAAMFSFARRQKYLAPDRKHEAALVEPMDVSRGGEIAIYTPDEFRLILENIDEAMIPAVVLGGLAGLRTTEVFRVTWEMIRFDAGVITLGKAFTKTRRRRNIPICEALRAWLEPHKKDSGRLYDYSDITGLENMMRDRWARMKNAAGLPLVEKRKNALRHSYGTYRFAQLQDEAVVSAQMGNSPKELREHYAELALPKDAETWFSIMPSRPANVTVLVAA